MSTVLLPSSKTTSASSLASVGLEHLKGKQANYSQYQIQTERNIHFQQMETNLGFHIVNCSGPRTRNLTTILHH